MSNPIPIFLVEDSPVCLAILKRMLSQSPLVKVVGEATNGKEALALIPITNPRVICADLEMPVMDGLQFTKELMARFPHPILVVSDYVHREHQHNIFQLLEAGAIDVFPKPRRGSQAEYLAQSQALIEKIQVLSGVVVIPRMAAPTEIRRSSHGFRSREKKRFDTRIVVIGASTGGPQVLQIILSRLPSNFSLPIICVQHLTNGFLEGLVGWLDSHCLLKVCIAQDHQSPQKGTVYFPQEGKHLELDPKGQFSHTAGAPLHGHRPSIDKTFGSVCKRYGRSTIGILLTGMGQDGVEGLKDIAQAGGSTVAQDEPSCFVFGMPKQAIEQGAVDHVLSPPEIADHLRSAVSV
jgi:two-component system chemotaxis response regulator CheB